MISLLSQTANELGNTEEYGNGLVDLEYALAHYDEFAANYQETETQESATERENVGVVEERLVQENTAIVETFEDVDYVEGRWGGENGHKVLVDNAIKENAFELSTEEITVFKLGAIYPDKEFPVSKAATNRNWHGGYKVNYIANYRFATRMAKYAGDTSMYSRAKGQSSDCFNQMKGQISTTKVGDKTYSQIFSENGIAYASKTAAQKKQLRKIFLYGMASHIVTDAFAHSAYCRCGSGGTYVKVSDKHNDDDPGVHTKRFYDAQEAMSMVIINYQESIMGSEIDFSPRSEDWGKKRDYWLRHVLKYAKEAAVDCTTSEINEMYQAINYEP